MRASPKSVPAVLASAAAAVLFLIAFDSVLFRTPWYYPWLEPNSSAGQVEAYLHWLKAAPPGSQREVLVFGDSRIAHGLSAPTATAASGNRIRFWNFGIAGTLPRDWYYILRDADPTRHRFAAIFLALDQYSDEDYREVYADRIIDLNFLTARLRPSDCLPFAESMNSPANRERAFLGCLLKGSALQSDFLDFLSHPLTRLRSASQWRDHGLADVTTFAGIDRNLRGLSADWAKHQIVFPPGLDQVTRDIIQATVMPSWPPHTGQTTRYRSLWLPKIFTLYAASSTPVVLFELPRAPLSKPESATPSTFIDATQPSSKIVILDRATFRDLEQPQFFFDGLHLNRTGRAEFSARLGAIAATLAR